MTATNGFDLDLVQSGHLADGDEVDRLLQQHATPYVARAAEALSLSIRDTSPPVSHPWLTGRMNRGWRSAVALDGGFLTGEVTNDVPYTGRRNATGRNAGFIERGVEAGKQAAINEIEQGVEAVAPHLWVKE